ncbi:hypothetical protein NXS19_005572 [Fusarium pseudograminearum]|nr:hypothetical protein NXS19_005572 [Fusarium pseudograminearum]
MSTMPASHGHSEACCNIPPVVTKGYEARGTYKDIGGYKTYVTGPVDAKKAIVVIYDIFGYFEQTLQGADILAFSDAHQKYKVFIPDWFKGGPCPIEIYPPDNDDKKKQLGEFFETYPPPRSLAKFPTMSRLSRSRILPLRSLAFLVTAGVAKSSLSVSRLTPTPSPLLPKSTPPWSMPLTPRVSLSLLCCSPPWKSQRKRLRSLRITSRWPSTLRHSRIRSMAGWLPVPTLTILVLSRSTRGVTRPLLSSLARTSKHANINTMRYDQ